MLPPHNGLILIDKPEGLTSHDVVDRVRRLLKIRSVGHAGTLDPFASGLLILGIGSGTKSLTSLVGLDKSYTTTLRLGRTSSTFDREGEIKVTKPDPSPPNEVEIERALPSFRGSFEQRAPLFSAKKRQGKKLYELARSGQATEEMRPTKLITIYSLTLEDYAWSHLRLSLRCSSGTYVRSLADDLGRALGVGAYAETLRRTNIGSFSIEQALDLASLTEDLVQKNIFSLPLSFTGQEHDGLVG